MTTKVIPIKQVGTMEIETNPMTELRNNYWMIQKLGVGGFGKVYLIKQVYSKKAVFLTYSSSIFEVARSPIKMQIPHTI